jgi:hypothetical protein
MRGGSTSEMSLTASTAPSTCFWRMNSSTRLWYLRDSVINHHALTSERAWAPLCKQLSSF